MSKIIDETEQGNNANLEPEASYLQGMTDGLALWGDVCGRQSNCESCPMQVVRNANLTCQQFAAKYPNKMLSILMELYKKDYTYFDEYCTRFPECNLDVEDLQKIMCRKAVFEGYCGCNGGDCTKCWLEPYTGDVTEFEAENETEEE